MKKVLILIFFIFSAHDVYADSDHYLAKDIESEIKTLLISQLLSNYDIELIRLLEISEMRFKNIDNLLVKSTGRVELIKVLGEFKAVRNLNTSFRTDENGEMVASLNQDLFTNIFFCKKIKWLYLHCGVPAGYVFEGKIELFVTRTGGGVVILCSHCSRKSGYALDGYLILEGRKKEGYVWFPASDL